ncbi:putative ribonuclease H-like domain-containing protein, partial [Tanacetum coccineum]
KSSTNKVKSGFTGAYSICTPSTSSTNALEKEVLVGFADEVIYSLFAKQTEDLDLLHEDLEQIDDVDIEEMDINWQIAMIAIRMKKECTAKGTHDGKKKRDSFYQHQELQNRDMLEFCGNKGIKQEYSNARTPQQNGVAKRMNMTLIMAARDMLADSLLPTTFWAEAVSTASYQQKLKSVLLLHLGFTIFTQKVKSLVILSQLCKLEAKCNKNQELVYFLALFKSSKDRQHCLFACFLS